MIPNIAEGQDGADFEFVLNYHDEFDGTGGPLSDRYYIEGMEDALHRAGNEGIDADGNLAPGESVVGKRHSLWYAGKDSPHLNDVLYEQDGSLCMGLKLVDEPDPTREQIVRDTGRVDSDGNPITVISNPQNNKVYGGWMSTWTRGRDENDDAIDHPDSPNLLWGPKTYFETEFDFSGMVTPGIRMSWWLMPGRENVSLAYDESGYNGVEIDIFEYENDQGVSQQVMQIKIISERAGGNTPNGSRNIQSLINVDIRDGKHTVGLLWMENRIVVYVDGLEVQRDDAVDANGAPLRIPQVDHYMIFSREGNSGAKNFPKVGEAQANPPYTPNDPGLYAKNMWEHLDTIPTDVGKFGYVRVWDVNPSDAVDPRIDNPDNIDLEREVDGPVVDEPVVIDEVVTVSTPEPLQRSAGVPSATFTEHDWFTLMRDIDPEIMIKDKVAFQFSGGAKKTIARDYIKKKVGDK